MKSCEELARELSMGDFDTAAVQPSTKERLTAILNNERKAVEGVTVVNDETKAAVTADLVQRYGIGSYYAEMLTETIRHAQQSTDLETIAAEQAKIANAGEPTEITPAEFDAVAEQAAEQRANAEDEIDARHNGPAIFEVLSHIFGPLAQVPAGLVN